MAVTKYKIYNFDSTKASQGVLCAMVLKRMENGDEVSTAEWTGEGPNPLKGVGICTFKQPSSFTLSINSIVYSFTENGNAVSLNASGYKLMLAETQDKASVVGNIVETASTTAITRGAGGEVTGITETEGDSSVMISGLEARDQFAISALKTLMEKSERDITTMSDNEKMYLCEKAYQWAANMMTQASKARATVETEGTGGGGGTTGDGTTRGISVDSSEVTETTDKLLNNIIVALERTDEKRTEGTNEVFYERVILPDLKKQIDEYMSHTETPEGGEPVTNKYGLFDLIKAIKDINVDVSTDDLVTAIQNQGKDADHPIYISGGGFPSRQVLASAFTEATIHDFLTFNAAGAVGYSTKEEVKKAILGYLNSYSTLLTLSTAVLGELTADAIYNKIQSKVDDRIKAWLQAAIVTVDGTTYSLTVNTPT